MGTSEFAFAGYDRAAKPQELASCRTTCSRLTQTDVPPYPPHELFTTVLARLPPLPKAGKQR